MNIFVMATIRYCELKLFDSTLLDFRHFLAQQHAFDIYFRS